jgi:tRNA (guanine37-N1)-methyltransferase
LAKKLQRRVGEAGKGKIYNSYDVLGGKIAIIKVPNENLEAAKKAAAAIMSVYKNLESVYLQYSPVAGSYRVRQLLCIAGKDNPVAVHREFGCNFKVDVSACYFSPRLSHERFRIASLVQSGEVVVNMFAGVGCFSIMIARQVKNCKVFSIDINPDAYAFMQENIRLNRVEHQVVPMLGDSKALIESELQHVADRVLMPLPEKTLEYLPTALFALRPSGGIIHYFDHTHAMSAKDAVQKTETKIAQTFEALGICYSFVFGRVIRSVGPSRYQTVIDIAVKKLPSKF